MTATIPAGVETARDLVSPAIAAAIERLSPDVRTVAAYHLGLADGEGKPAGAPGSGKALRPALTLLSARAARVPPERALPAAVAVELVHNFSLLHDDIMDGDTERRHRPTAWTVFRRDDVSVTECLDMAADKTAALMACACSIGAIYVGAQASLAMGLAAFGAYAGQAFQLTDDLLGIWGAPELTGKPVHSDLRARKKSLPVVAAMTSGTRAGRDLGALLGSSGQLSEDDLLRAAALVESAGGRRWAEAEADAALAAALSCLADTEMASEVRAEFAQIAEFIAARQW